MKTARSIFLAFILNLFFSIFEFVGGLITGSVALVSDAVHDMADAAGIGISYLFEKKSSRQPDEVYTYGYARFSAVGSLITIALLLVGSVVVIYNAAERIIRPLPIRYDTMVVFALIGVCVNCGAVFFTREGASLNQKAIKLHMLEDALGWIMVLVGAIVMRFTDFAIIDPIMSIGIAVFILVNAVKNLREVMCVFLERVPLGINVKEIQKHIAAVEGVLDVHHIHIWSIDGRRNYATIHVVTDAEPQTIKETIRKELKDHGIHHATLELETQEELCHEKDCHVEHTHSLGHHHH